MHKQGLIERSPHPRHPTILELELTDVGGEALVAARLRADPVEQRVHQVLSRDELDTLPALLLRVIDAIDDDRRCPRLLAAIPGERHEGAMPVEGCWRHSAPALVLGRGAS